MTRLICFRYDRYLGPCTIVSPGISSPLYLSIFFSKTSLNLSCSVFLFVVYFTFLTILTLPNPHELHAVSISVNLDLFLLFYERFNTSKFQSRFHVNNVNMKEFPPWVTQGHCKPVAKSVSIVCIKTIWCQSCAKNYLTFISLFNHPRCKSRNHMRTNKCTKLCPLATQLFFPAKKTRASIT